MTPILNQIDAAIRRSGYYPDALLLKDVRAYIVDLERRLAAAETLLAHSAAKEAKDDQG